MPSATKITFYNKKNRPKLEEILTNVKENNMSIKQGIYYIECIYKYCIQCYKPLKPIENIRCERCLNDNTNREKNKRSQRRKNNLCVSCGKERNNIGEIRGNMRVSRCESCIKIHRKYKEKYKLKQR